MSQVKFKIGFTIDAETLGAIIAKMLPVEDVSVEEIPIKSTLARLTDHAIALGQNPEARKRGRDIIAKYAKPKRASPGPSLTKGINAIIIAELKSGPKRAAEIQPKVTAAGFSLNSVNSRLESLRLFGVITRVGDGLWRLIQKPD
jgi:hypothetical protein